MNPHRITAKFFIRDADLGKVDLDAFIPFFHGWIQQQASDVMLIDVADYKHVPEGPGIVLIGHEGDFGLDFAEDRPGMMYTGKRGWSAQGLADKLRDTLRHALWGCKQVEEDGTLGLRFRTDELRIVIPDRLEAPNDAETFEAARAEIEAVVGDLYGDVGLELKKVHPDARQALALHVTAKDAPDVATLVERCRVGAAHPT